MDPRRLLETSTFRLVLIYLALFGASAFALLGYLYYATAGVLERQTTETIEAEIRGLVEQYRTQGLVRLSEVLGDRSADNPNLASIYLLIDGFGRRLAGNLDRWPPEMVTPGEWHIFAVEVHPERANAELRRARATSLELPGGYRLLVGREVEDRLELQNLIKQALGWGLALTMLLGLAGAYWASQSMLSRVDEVNRTARRIMRGDLGQRMPIGKASDEFDQLAANLNAMLDEIERLMQGMREVTDNIAHDLRTPLNRMRSRIDVALLGDPDQAETRRLLEQTLADAEAMIATFNAILDIARAEARADPDRAESIALDELIGDIADLYEPLAEERGLAFAVDCPKGLTLRADRHLLAQAIANLLDNAIKYTPEGGRVSLRVAPGPAIIVSDTGPGIPAAERGHVLERFVRLGTDRSTPGNGLGLSLVDAVARRHKASLRLEDNDPGLKVTLAFPAEAA